jgi:hypothetical protein
MRCIQFEIPGEIEQQIRQDEPDLSASAREAFLVDLYRRDRIRHGQLARALGLDAYATDGVLKRHGVFLEISPEELEAESRSLEAASPRRSADR